MSIPRHTFANVVPIDKRKLGSRVDAVSQITSILKANANSTYGGLRLSRNSVYYRSTSGLLNDYSILTQKRGITNNLVSQLFNSGDVLDGEVDGQVLDGDADVPELILDGN